jgi:hypothetical protein
VEAAGKSVAIWRFQARQAAQKVKILFFGLRSVDRPQAIFSAILLLHQRGQSLFRGEFLGILVYLPVVLGGEGGLILLKRDRPKF